MWVEKILDPGEPLRDWPVDGTVGYEFLNDVAALFVDPAGEAPLTDLWVELSGDDRPFGELAFEAKLEQARTTFAPEVERLRARGAARGRRPRARARVAPRLPHLRRAVVGPRRGRRPRGDRRGRPAGVARARADAARTRGWDAFVTRFQQTTPPVMAKGVEDTAFYRYARLLALNDVGGDPAASRCRVDAFHAANRERAERFPRNLLVTQTHDTKRSGDVRARIGALAGMAERVGGARAPLARGVPSPTPAARRRRRAATSSSRRWSARGRSSPSRLEAYLEKALREAKRNTTWIEPDTRTRTRVQAFAARCTSTATFLRDFEPFAAEVARAGRARRARPAAAQADRPGRARHLPGRRAARALARRPRQPPPGRLGCAPRAARRGRRRRRAADETRKLQLIVRALALRAPRPGRVRRRRTSRSTPAPTPARSCAAGRSSPRWRCAATCPRDGRPPDRQLARRARRARPGRPRGSGRPGRGARDRVARANCPVASGAPCAR